MEHKHDWLEIVGFRGKQCSSAWATTPPRGRGLVPAVRDINGDPQSALL